MLYLRDRFGPTRCRGCTATAPARAWTGWPRRCRGPLYDVIHDFQTMTLVDKMVGDPAARRFRAAGRLASCARPSTWTNPAAYDCPGAAPNGADYVRLPAGPRPEVGRASPARRPCPPSPLAWTVRGRRAVLRRRRRLDAAAVVAVTVPAATTRCCGSGRSTRPRPDYDFGYVTVSTDGGQHLHRDRRRPHRRGAARSRRSPAAANGFVRARLRPLRVRREEDPARFPLRQRRLGQRGRLADRRHLGRRPDRRDGRR